MSQWIIDDNDSWIIESWNQWSMTHCPWYRIHEQWFNEPMIYWIHDLWFKINDSVDIQWSLNHGQLSLDHLINSHWIIVYESMDHWWQRFMDHWIMESMIHESLSMIPDTRTMIQWTNDLLNPWSMIQNKWFSGYSMIIESWTIILGSFD